jgi:hypothetical protein
MVGEKAWKDGMARLCSCFPSASKNLSPEDIAVRDLAYHDAIAPKLADAAWLRAVVEVTRAWEYPFALPPPQMLLEAGEGAARWLEPNPERRTDGQIEAGKQAAAAGLALIKAKAKTLGFVLPQLPVRDMKALAPLPDEPCLVVLTDERREELLAMAKRVVEATETQEV